MDYGPALIARIVGYIWARRLKDETLLQCSQKLGIPASRLRRWVWLSRRRSPDPTPQVPPSALLRPVDRLGNRTLFRYNSLGKLSEAARVGTKPLQWEYDAEGNLVRRVGPDGTAFEYTYGPFDLLAKVAKPGGGQLHLTYDTEARRVAVENEVGRQWRYQYDAAGKIIQEEDFHGRVQRFFYNSAGECAKRINGAAEEIEFEWNSVGKLKRKRCSAGSVTAYEYDDLDRVARAVCDGVEVEFQRDAYGRVVREQQGERWVQSTYDLRGGRLSRQTSHGHVAQWDRDRNGQVIGLRLPNRQTLTFVRDEAGREVARRMCGGLAVRQKYDALNRLVSQWAGLDTPGVETLRPVVERQYCYAANSAPIEIRDSRWGVSQFSYDADGRIKRAKRERGATEEFRYDRAGDITWVGVERTAGSPHTQGAFSERKHSYGDHGRLDRVGEVQYFWDADGRLSGKVEDGHHWQFRWTTEGQLKSLVTPEGQQWRYEYDAFGRRVRKTGPNGATEYLWDGALVAEEIGARESSSWFFAPGTFRPLVKVEHQTAFMCVTDQAGTPLELIDSRGKVAWSARFGTWGDVDEVNINDTSCTLRFQGQLHDEESGLNYNCHRYYDPCSGNYLTPDPIGLSGGMRAYGYVYNPLSWIDPLGLAFKSVDFTDSPDLYPTGEGEQNIVKIPMQGSRGRDFTQAYNESGIDRSVAENDYTWHHVDDFNPETGETTMQLVKTEAHEASLPHQGSVKQFEQEFGVKYGKPEAVGVSQEKGWLRGSSPRENPSTGKCG